MPSSFPRTLGSLDTEGRGPRTAAIGIAVLLLATWTAWFFGSRVALYAVSDIARLEVDASPYPVEAPVSGRVVSTALTLGRAVSAGDVLVELDVRAQNLSVGEEQSRIDGVARQIEQLRAEIAEERNSRRAEEAAAAVAQQEAQALHAEAVAASDFAANAEQRTRALADKGLIGQAELVRAEAEAKQKRAAAEALRLTADRLVAEQLHRETAHRIAVERLEGEITALRAQRQTGTLTVERLQHEGALRQIVAPVSGTLAEVATLAVGRVLQPGQAVATIVPAGGLRVVAGFAPAEAFGRVREGQSARLRLEGFPPTQYGSIQAVVASVARELREGRVRVELALGATHSNSVPMQHGTPGTVEVEVERISPAALVLRAVGRRLSPPSAAERP
jgi:multidrug resistance efflux pump